MTPVQKILANLSRDVREAEFWWQAVALAIALTLAWFVGRKLKAMLAAREMAERSELAQQMAEFGAGGFARLATPVCALLFAWIAQEIVGHFLPTNLFALALPLLMAFVAIRAFVYMLAQVFSARFLAAWERWIAITVWVGVALHFTGVSPAIVAMLEKLHVVVGKQKITAWAITQGMFTVALTLLITLWLASTIERRLMNAQSLEANGRVALARFVRALLVVLAVLCSMAFAGIDLTVLSVFGGALGVGLGLGLQKIASNYVSGYIILLDKSIRIGDMVTVEKYTGTVTHITTRYSVLKALDGTEAIIPNETLLSQPVLNQSLTSDRVRVAIQVQVAYDTNLDTVKVIMLEAAAAHPRVLHDPVPMVFLLRFADSGIELELGFWISDPENGLLPVKSDLNFAIWAQFQAQGIEIPYPHRQLLDPILSKITPPDVK